MEQCVHLLDGGRAHRMEYRCLTGGVIDAVKIETMQMEVQIGGGSETLYQGDGSGYAK